MTALRLALIELRAFRRGLPRLALVAIALVPLLYGAVYLWSSWDPFGRVDRIPVAVVNQDSPVRVRGQRVAGGTQFTQQLRASGAFDWRFVDAREAADGLKEGRYLFTITVPRDFSRRLTSSAGSRPRQARIALRLDDQNGFVVSRIADSARVQLQRQANTAAVTTYAQSALGDVGTIRTQLREALTALGDVRDATGALSAGTRQVLDGLAPLQGGTSALTRSSRDLAGGLAAIARTTDALGKATAATVGPLTGALADAAIAARGPSRVAVAAADEVAARARRVERSLGALDRAHPELAGFDGFSALRRTAARVRRDAATTDARLRESDRALARLVVRTREIRAGGAGAVAQLRSGTGADDLVRASRDATSGLDAIDAAVRGAAPGARRLATAADAVDRGVGRIERRLRAALRQVPAQSAAERERTAQVLGSPVDITETEDHPARVYGRGLAPFFFPVGLWVFSILVFLLVRPLNPRLLASRAGAPTVVLAGWLPPVLLGLAGAVVLFLGVALGLGLDAVQPVATVGVMLLTVATFVAIVQLLRATLGAVGDVVALVLLMLQLGSAGGLYPLQTSDGVFRVLHPILPMGYAVDALRVTISGGETAHALLDVVVLLGFLLAALGLTVLVARRRRVWGMTQLKPEVEI
jgi:putative membrane protein